MTVDIPLDEQASYVLQDFMARIIDDPPDLERWENEGGMVAIVIFTTTSRACARNL